MWYDRKPYVGFICTFGCKTIALIIEINKGKFEAKEELMTIVGYSNESKAYILWHKNGD